MLIDLLARRWGSAAGGRDGMSIAASFLAWTLAGLGHRVRAHHPASDPPPWQHALVEWVACPTVEQPADWTADLVLTTIAPSWPRLVAAARAALATGRLAYWHHHGPIPYGAGCVLARCSAGLGLREQGWSRTLTLPPSTWAAEAGGPTGDCLVAAGASRAKGGPVALQVARRLTGHRWLVLEGRANEPELAPWRELPHVEVIPAGSPPEAWLDRARLLLQPTRVEVHPLLPIEAAARGIPVVISDLPGCRAALGPAATYLPEGAPLARWEAAVLQALAEPPAPLARRPYAEVVAGALASLGAAPVAPPRPAPTSPWPVVPLVPRPAGTLPRVLLAADVKGWAFDQNLRDLAATLAGRFDFAHAYVADGSAARADYRKVDAVFIPYHRWSQLDRLLPRGRVLGSLRAQWFWPERQCAPGPAEFDLVNRFAAFHLVTKRNYDEVRRHCPGAVYLTNPVAMARFPEPTPVRGVVASWNGNARHDSAGAGVDVKGFRSIIEPACAAAGVPLVVAEYHTSRRTPAEMPAFYRQGSVALCASLFEGASNSVMEAMAAGQALITTDAGNIREIRDSQLEHLGESGIVLLEQRTVEAFVAALRELQADPDRVARMGLLNRQEIAARWSWAAWADRYEAFLRRATDAA